MSAAPRIRKIAPGVTGEQLAAMSKRTCSICHESGHNAKTCEKRKTGGGEVKPAPARPRLSPTRETRTPAAEEHVVRVRVLLSIEVLP